MIVSASRRTDIPACFPEEFMERIRSGFCTVKNPFSGKESRISLAPGDVDCIVFWSKNPGPLMAHLPELAERGFAFYFQFTLTPYDRKMERFLPPKPELIRTFRMLSERIGRDRVVWRYDPIIFSDSLCLTGRWHEQQFRILSDQLAPYTDQCVISFLDFYGKCRREPVCRAFREATDGEMLDLAGRFARIAGEAGLRIAACAEKLDLSPAGVESAHCIDAERIGRITGKQISSARDRGQRKECGCAVSRDIGRYGSCRNGCVYCYAS